MGYSFFELTKPRFIEADKENNDVSLLVTISEGMKYGTDGTCKSTAALKQFFGFNADSIAKNNSALASLNAYQESIQLDLDLLAILPNNSKYQDIQKKKARTPTAS